jgi:hypothetical protein
VGCRHVAADRIVNPPPDRTNVTASPSAGEAVVQSAICWLAVSGVDTEENRFPRK